MSAEKAVRTVAAGSPLILPLVLGGLAVYVAWRLLFRREDGKTALEQFAEDARRAVTGRPDEPVLEISAVEDGVAWIVARDASSSGPWLLRAAAANDFGRLTKNWVVRRDGVDVARGELQAGPPAVVDSIPRADGRYQLLFTNADASDPLALALEWTSPGF